MTIQEEFAAVQAEYTAAKIAYDEDARLWGETGRWSEESYENMIRYDRLQIRAALWRMGDALTNSQLSQP